MSQAGIIDVEGSHPQIPTMFVTNMGTAIPIANVLEILGTTVVAYGTPLETTGSGNTVTIVAQYASAAASSVATNAGFASFDSHYFTVDANGYVTFNGSAGTESFTVDAATAPGTNPVVPNGSGNITVTGGQVAAGTTVNVIRTDSLAANTYTIQIQRSQTAASSTVGDNGVSHFNSANFTVDANGFVALAGTGGAPIQTITGNTGGAEVPLAGNFNILGTGSITVTGSANTETVQLTGLTNHAIQIGAGTATLTQLGAGTTGQVLQTNTGADPTWSTATYPSTTTINQILYSSSANTVAGLATANNGVLTTGTSGTPVITALASDGQLIIGSSAGAPAAATLTAGTGISITNGHNSISIAVSGSGVGETITGNSGGALSPTAGNWNIVGNNTALNGFATYTTGATSTLTVNSFGTNKWVVNPTSGVGTHTTIQAAVTAASAGDTVYVTANSSAYTENITLKAGVNIVGATADAFTPNVTIAGTLTLTGAGTVSISGINLQTNSAALLAVTGSAASIVNLSDCYLNCTNNTGITFSSSSASSQINIFNCMGDLGTTGIAIFSHSSAGSILFEQSRFTNSGGSSTASTCSAGGCNGDYSRFQNPITFSSTGAGTFEYCLVSTAPQNVTAMTLGGVAVSLKWCRFDSGSASALSISSSTNQMIGCVISSTNTNAITGAGTLSYSSLSFINTSSTVNVTTQSSCGTLQGSTNTAPSAGFLGEQITSGPVTVAISNATPTNITSITLTSGVWDITGFGGTQYTSFTGSSLLLSISTISATLLGAQGDQFYYFASAGAGVAVGYSGSVPAYRVVISTNTTYYLVCQTNFTGGTATALGRISAVRVG